MGIMVVKKTNFVVGNSQIHVGIVAESDVKQAIMSL